MLYIYPLSYATCLFPDSNWRWTDVDGQNCYTGNEWNQTYCSGNDEASAQACAAQCAVEGADSQYDNTYGVKTDGNKLNLTCRFFFSNGDPCIIASSLTS